MDNDSESARTAENLILVRGLRAEIFPSEIFDEHAWNMMLRLFVAQARGQTMSDADIIAATDTPAGVGQRWLAHLVADEQIMPYTAGNSLTLTPAALDHMRTFLRLASRTHQSDGPA